LGGRKDKNMNKHLITFKVIDGENEFHEFEVVQNAQDYQDIELIANYYGSAEPSNFDADTYMILDGLYCKVYSTKPISENEIKTLQKLSIIA
jgi:hypothetical protein